MKKSPMLEEVSDLAPEFIKLTKEVLFEDFWKRSELSQRDKSLVTITTLAAQGR